MTTTDFTRPNKASSDMVTDNTEQARRITFVIEALTVGGAERMVVDIANELSSRGDHVNVICLSSMGELATSLSGDIGIITLNKKPGFDPSIIKRLRRTILSQKADVVNSHLWTANLWSRLALVRSSVPVVVTEHNRDVWKQIHNRVIDRVLSKVTARLVAVSNDTANFYKKDVGVAEDLITVINNGVDTLRYSKGDGTSIRALLAPNGKFLVGTVGRLAEQKNHVRLVETAAMLKSWDLPVNVVIAGDGPERQRIEEAIVENDVADYVTLLGERSDIPDLLSALDVFVLSSDREGHPLSALEAQAAGTPIVLTDAGGSADAISSSGDEYGGLLVDQSPDALAQALKALVLDKERLERMSSFASGYALEHFDKKTMIDSYSDVFDEAIVSVN